MGCQYPTNRMFVFMAHTYFRVCFFKDSTRLPLLIKQLSISIWPIRHNYWGIKTFSFYTVQKWKRYHKKRPIKSVLPGKKNHENHQILPSWPTRCGHDQQVEGIPGRACWVDLEAQGRRKWWKMSWWQETFHTKHIMKVSSMAMSKHHARYFC